MWIGLMADIPDEPIMGSVEYRMQRNGQFNNTKACTQMSASNRDGINYLIAQFVGQLHQFIARKTADNGWIGKCVKQRC